MNVAHNTALRQSKAVRAQLAALQPQPDISGSGSGGGSTPAEIGNVAASLAAFSKSIDEYGRHADNEPIAKRQEEARERIRRFRDDLADFRGQVDALRRAREEATLTADRGELLGRRPYASAASPAGGSAGSSSTTAENPYSDAAVRSSAAATQGMTASGSGYGYGSAEDQRERHVTREQQFLSGAHSALDSYIARGQAALTSLGEQREMMKGTQRRLYSVANQLGVSGDVIRMVERRAREDRWIFGAGIVVFFLFCWLCLHYLRR